MKIVKPCPQTFSLQNLHSRPNPNPVQPNSKPKLVPQGLRLTSLMLEWFDMRCEDNIVVDFSHCFHKALITFPTGSITWKNQMSHHSNINELTLKSCRPPPTHKMGNTPTLSFDKPIKILELICTLHIMYKTRLSYFPLESIKSVNLQPHSKLLLIS